MIFDQPSRFKINLLGACRPYREGRKRYCEVCRLQEIVKKYASHQSYRKHLKIKHPGDYSRKQIKAPKEYRMYMKKLDLEKLRELREERQARARDQVPAVYAESFVGNKKKIIRSEHHDPLNDQRRWRGRPPKTKRPGRPPKNPRTDLSEHSSEESE